MLGIRERNDELLVEDNKGGSGPVCLSIREKPIRHRANQSTVMSPYLPKHSRGQNNVSILELSLSLRLGCRYMVPGWLLQPQPSPVQQVQHPASGLHPMAMWNYYSGNLFSDSAHGSTAARLRPPQSASPESDSSALGLGEAGFEAQTTSEAALETAAQSSHKPSSVTPCRLERRPLELRHAGCNASGSRGGHGHFLTASSPSVPANRG